MAPGLVLLGRPARLGGGVRISANRRVQYASFALDTETSIPFANDLVMRCENCADVFASRIHVASAPNKVDGMVDVLWKDRTLTVFEVDLARFGPRI